VETIKNYWKTHNKWTNPGYHYIIKADGEIVPLQPEDKPSNGVAGYNSVSINVCYIGGVDKQGRPIDNRTEAQKQSLITILKDLKTRYPDAVIMGHRDIWGSDPKNWKKACPCFDAYREYEHIMEPEKETPQPSFEDIGTIVPEFTPEPIKVPSKPIVEPKIEQKESLLSTVFNLILSIFKKK